MESLRPLQCRVTPLHGVLDCFVTLPRSIADGVRQELQYKGPQVVVVEITKGGRTEYATWSYNDSEGAKELGIPVLLLKQLQFADGDQVGVRVHLKAAKAREVHVVPVSVDDSEIVEHNAVLLEEFILRQLRVAYEGLVCPIHVRKGVHVCMRVTRIGQYTAATGARGGAAPAPFVVLDDGTELVVETKMRKKPTAGDEGGADDAAAKPASHAVRVVRHAPLEGAAAAASSAPAGPTSIHVWVARDVFTRLNWVDGGMLPGVLASNLVGMAWKKQQQQQQQGASADTSLAALRRHVFDVVVHPHDGDDASLAANEAVTSASGIPLGARLVIDPFLESSGVHSELLAGAATPAPASPATRAAKVHADAWKDALAKLRVIMRASETGAEARTCAPRVARGYRQAPAAADGASSQITQGHLHSTLIVGSGGSGKSHFLQALKERVGVYVAEFAAAADPADPAVGEKENAADGGAGAAAAPAQPATAPRAKSAKLLEAFQRKLADAVANAPSVLFVDDLEKLAGAQPGDPAPHDPNLAMRVSLFNTALQGFARGGAMSGVQGYGNTGVTIVATAAQVEAVDAKTAALFNHVVKLSLPDDAGRKRVCRYAFADRALAPAGGVLSKVARVTNNYTPRDLVLLCEKAAHHKTVGDAGGAAGTAALVTQNHMDAALDGFAPASVAGINLFKPAEGAGWGEVGGMDDAKKTFNETIILPAKYPELYRNLPIKLRSGILLYGPTGCGKSHIISCAVAEAGLNCIQVAGPELLNKYIGQSEQRVREVFEQAAAAAPCVLFFDEFDSIAPQRGHDNTGVTDRVVNQLLCHLDGAEERGKVYVVAATARPDLIDKALLRPGRLDVQLYCGMPTAEERADILRAGAKDLRLAEDVDFTDLAERTAGFTAADLVAMLSTTRLKCVQEVVDTATALANMNTGDGDGGAGDDAAAARGYTTLNAKPENYDELDTYIGDLNIDTSAADAAGDAPAAAASAVNTRLPLITQEMLLTCLADSHPSISAADARKNEARYAAFQESRGGNEKGKERGGEDEQGQRVTLA